MGCVNPLFVQTGRVSDDEGETVFDQELPVGSECVIKGAATPATGPDHCLDPSAITYSPNLYCLTTGMIIHTLLPLRRHLCLNNYSSP